MDRWAGGFLFSLFSISCSGSPNCCSTRTELGLSPADHLEKLKYLHEEGAISDEEFDIEKQDLLDKTRESDHSVSHPVGFKMNGRHILYIQLENPISHGRLQQSELGLKPRSDLRNDTTRFIGSGV